MTQIYLCRKDSLEVKNMTCNIKEYKICSDRVLEALLKLISKKLALTRRETKEENSKEENGRWGMKC